MHDVIVVCVDGSPGSYAAVEEAAELAKRFEAALFALSVLEGLPKCATTMNEVDEVKRERETYFEGVGARIDALADRHRAKLTHVVRIGRAADVIVHFGREVGADLVVLGYTRRSHLLGFAPRTTARKVNAHSPASVLIVKGDGLDAERDRLQPLSAPAWLVHLSADRSGGREWPR